MNRTRYSFAHMSLQVKMLIFLFLTVIFPLSFFIPLLQIYQNSAIEDEIKYINQERSEQTSEQLEFIYEQINSVSNLYFLDNNIENILRTGHIYDYRQLELDQRKIIPLQKRYNATVPKVDLHVTIISNDNRIYGNGSYNKKVPLSGKENLWWYQQLLQSPWQTLWIKDDYLDKLHGTLSPSYIYSVRFLKRFDNWENHGILIVSFLESDLVKLYANTVPKSGSVFIINRDGSLVSMVDNAKIYESGLLDRLPEGYSSSYKEKINNADYQIVTNTVRNPLWKVVTATPDRQLRMQYKRANLLLPLLTSLFLIILATFSIVVSRYIVNPIEILTKSMQKIGQSENLSQRIQIQSSDEIGILSSEFNNMLGRIDALMTTIVAEQEAKRNAELQSLYAQINPHFIYNVLTSVRFLIVSGDAERADNALFDFTGLLRSSISGGSEFCTIQQEVDLLKKYINIQQLFFETPFQVVWDITPQVRLCKIIKLSLQPIVENAIMHGLKSKEGYRKLSIKIAPAGKNILITIADNGIGTNKVFSFKEVSGEYSKNIGLKNVHSRIALHFGKPYGVYFSSVPGQGTTVKLLVPRIESPKGIM